MQVNELPLILDSSIIKFVYWLKKILEVDNKRHSGLFQKIKFINPRVST